MSELPDPVRHDHRRTHRGLLRLGRRPRRMTSLRIALVAWDRDPIRQAPVDQTCGTLAPPADVAALAEAA
jgi:hypothetical protein